MQTVSLAALATMLIISCAFTYSASSRDRTLSLLLNQYAADDEPGIQYVVVSESDTIFNQSVGLSNVASNTALEASQTMAAFSMTKTLTAIAVLQLVEQNKIKLDDKVTGYVTHPYDPSITVRHLLNHTAGIPNPIPLKWVHLAQAHDDYDEQVELKKILSEYSAQDFQPGKRYQYSNIGYWLLGSVIARVSEKSYAQYLSEHLFEPLNLDASEIGFTIHDENNHANGYLKQWSFMGLFGRLFVDAEMLGKNESGWRHVKNVYLNGPSFGGAIGSARAFATILQDLLSTNSILLGAAAKQLLYQQQITNAGTDIDMTLGWHIADIEGITYYYKEGGGAGFHSEMRIYPQHGFASVITSNRTSFDSRQILSELDLHFVTTE